jgi:hypothetical protein
MSTATRVAQRHAATKIAATKVKGKIPFEVEIFGLDNYHWKNQGPNTTQLIAEWKGGVRVGKSYQTFKAKIFFQPGKPLTVELLEGPLLAGGVLKSPEVLKFVREQYKP